MNDKLDEVVLAEPRGFCAGVDRAIEIVERALTRFGAPIYVRHEIVHNTYVVNDLKAKGAIFIEDLADVPPGATLVFSAHGVSKAVRHEAAERGFQVFDATCPLVTKVHVEVAKLAKEGFEFIMIGHKGHPEVEGTMGQLSEGIHLVEAVADVAKVRPKRRRASRWSRRPRSAWTTRPRSWPRSSACSPTCASPSSRTSATPRRTARTRSSCWRPRSTSSSSSAARPAATATACASWRSAWARRPTWSMPPKTCSPQWFDAGRRVGLTAGASAPELLVQQVVVRLRELGAVTIRKMDGVSESVHFPLPRGLGDRSMSEAAASRS